MERGRKYIKLNHVLRFSQSNRMHVVDFNNILYVDTKLGVRTNERVLESPISCELLLLIDIPMVGQIHGDFISRFK